MKPTETHAEALELLARMTTAPDHTTWVNLVEELQQRYLAQASIVDMLAASNEAWALEAQQKNQAVQSFIDNVADVYDDAFDTDVVKDLAEAFCIDLEVEYEVEITVTYSATVTAPRGTSKSDIRQAVYVEHDEIKSNDSDFEVGHTYGSDGDNQEVKVTN